MSSSQNSFFDNFVASVCELCGSELFPFQVAGHAEFHLMMGEEDVES